MKPWKDLTDRFDELSIWLDELEGRVERDLVRVQEEGVEGGDPLDLIVNIKVELMSLMLVTLSRVLVTSIQTGVTGVLGIEMDAVSTRLQL